MEITEIDVQNTVLELFARRRLVAGDVIWLTRLEEFWADTRLRRADLVIGIAKLCSAEMLEIEEQEGRTTLSLTPTGEIHALEILAAGADYWGRYLREELLPAVRVNSVPSSADRGGRRYYEAEISYEAPWVK